MNTNTMNNFNNKRNAFNLQIVNEDFCKIEATVGTENACQNNQRDLINNPRDQNANSNVFQTETSSSLNFSKTISTSNFSIQTMRISNNTLVNSIFNNNLNLGISANSKNFEKSKNDSDFPEINFNKNQIIDEEEICNMQSHRKNPSIGSNLSTNSIVFVKKVEISNRSIFYTPSTICNYYQHSNEVTPNKTNTGNIFNSVNIRDIDEGINSSRNNNNNLISNNAFDKKTPIKYNKSQINSASVNSKRSDTSSVNKTANDNNNTSPFDNIFRIHVKPVEGSLNTLANEYKKSLNISHLEIEDVDDGKEEVKSPFTPTLNILDRKNLNWTFNKIKTEETEDEDEGILTLENIIKTEKIKEKISEKNLVVKNENLILKNENIYLKNENFSFDITNNKQSSVNLPKAIIQTVTVQTKPLTKRKKPENLTINTKLANETVLLKNPKKTNTESSEKVHNSSVGNTNASNISTKESNSAHNGPISLKKVNSNTVLFPTYSLLAKTSPKLNTDRAKSNSTQIGSNESKKSESVDKAEAKTYNISHNINIGKIVIHPGDSNAANNTKSIVSQLKKKLDMIKLYSHKSSGNLTVGPNNNNSKKKSISPPKRIKLTGSVSTVNKNLNFNNNNYINANAKKSVSKEKNKIMEFSYNLNLDKKLKNNDENVNNSNLHNASNVSFLKSQKKSNAKVISNFSNYKKTGLTSAKQKENININRLNINYLNKNEKIMNTYQTHNANPSNYILKTLNNTNNGLTYLNYNSLKDNSSKKQIKKPVLSSKLNNVVGDEDSVIIDEC